MSCQREFAIVFSCMVLLIVPSGHCSEIIGGQEVIPHSLPFMALLQRNKPVCGGTLIDPSWVLTAAHCKDIETVLLGVHSIKADERDSRQIIKVEKRIPHPEYIRVQKGNDLQLLKLEKLAKETNTVKFLQLEKNTKDPPAGSHCLVAGWGRTDNNTKTMSDVLMSVKVNVIDRATCNSPDYYNQKPVITKGMVCAGSDGITRADSCKGDSGGPLVCNGVQVGITSFGEGCGLIKKPGVYTFLSKDQLKWIKKTMKKNKF